MPVFFFLNLKILKNVNNMIKQKKNVHQILIMIMKSKQCYLNKYCE